MRAQRRREQGFSLIEFTLAGIPLMLLLISIIEMSLAMWNYHTLQFAVCEGARYSARHGQGCTYTGNSCSVTVATIANEVTTAGTGLVKSRMALTLTSTAGSISCNPVSTCSSNSTVWPPTGANSIGNSITISATYPAQTGLMFLFMPASGYLKFTALTFSASSTELVLF